MGVSEVRREAALRQTSRAPRQDGGGRPQPGPVRQHRACQLLRAVPQPRQRDVSAKVLENFYQTDPISRASPTMAKCVTAVKAQRQSAYAASRKVNELATQTTINIHVKICS